MMFISATSTQVKTSPSDTVSAPELLPGAGPVNARVTTLSARTSAFSSRADGVS